MLPPNGHRADGKVPPNVFPMHRVHNYLDIGTIFSIVSMSSSAFTYSYTNSMHFNTPECARCRLSVLNPWHLNLNLGTGIKITTDVICAVYLFKGPKVIGNVCNHMSNGHFLIFDWKSFAVNDSLESASHRHHQMLGFVLGLTGFCCNCPSCLSFRHFPVSFASIACSIGLRFSVWLGHCRTFSCLP